jgi:hypothetical protein
LNGTQHLFTLEYERDGYHNLLPIYKDDMSQAYQWGMGWLSRMGSQFRYVGITAWPYGMVINRTRLPGTIDRQA